MGGDNLRSPTFIQQKNHIRISSACGAKCIDCGSACQSPVNEIIHVVLFMFINSNVYILNKFQTQVAGVCFD